MRQVCLLVAMLMMCSVSGHGSDNMSEQEEAASSIDSIINRVRRQSTRPRRCGMGPVVRRKRHLENGGFDNDENADQLDKILGGYRATRGEVPWQVSIFNDGEYRCSGVVLSEFWILTAAECVYPHYTSNLRVTVGDYRLAQFDEGEQAIQVAQIFTHGDYNETTKEHNIALIKVNQSSDGHGIRFNRYTQTICLPLDGESPRLGTQLTISGWGQSSHLGHSVTNILKKAVLAVVDRTHCRTRGGQIARDIICAGGLEDSTACLGDTGGPAVYFHDDAFVLVGIVSSTSYCAQPNLSYCQVLRHTSYGFLVISVCTAMGPRNSCQTGVANTVKASS